MGSCVELSVAIIAFLLGVVISLYFGCLYLACKTKCFHKDKHQKEMNKFKREFARDKLLVHAKNVELPDRASLGEGHSGGVKMGYIIRHPTSRANYSLSPRPTTRVEVAVKLINPYCQPTEEILREASTMRQIKHENIVQLIGVSFIKNSVPLIMMEKMPQNLKDFLDRSRNSHVKATFTMKVISSTMVQVCDAVQFMHQKGFVHRDIAARNVMLCHHNSLVKVKLSDFGLSRQTTRVNSGTTMRNDPDEAYTGVSLNRDLPSTTAPEWVTHQKYFLRSDVWMLGFLCWEMVTYGQTPRRCVYGGPNVNSSSQTNNASYSPNILIYTPNINNSVPEQIRNLLRDQCWNKEHTQRPSSLKLKQEFEHISRDFQLARTVIPIESHC